MTKDAKTHAENRKQHCAACGVKSPKCFPMTESIAQLVQQEVFSCYDSSDASFPCGICSTCRANLFVAKKGGVVPVAVRERWKALDYSRFRAPTRNGPCTACSMCNAGRYTFSQVKGKLWHWRFSAFLDATTHLCKRPCPSVCPSVHLSQVIFKQWKTSYPVFRWWRNFTWTKRKTRRIEQ